MIHTVATSSQPDGLARISNSAYTKLPLWFCLVCSLLFGSCAKDDMVPLESPEAIASAAKPDKVKAGYEVTNLVADVAGYDAELIDPNLVNAWGVAIGSTGAFWISATGTDLSVIYDDDGNTLRPPVTMTGAPTGQVFNTTTGFGIPDVGVSRFIFVTEEGTITAWRTGNTAPTMVDNSAGDASYTGVEIAMSGGQPYLYIANVGEGEIEVYDANWNYVDDIEFEDPTLPAGARPFNVRLIDGQLWVTYVGPGGGFVNVFTTNGTFVRRFASGGTLAAPWGITKTPPEFGLGQAILVGNFGDGRINVYNKNGQFKGQLGDEEGNPIAIDGLWALIFEAGAFNRTEEVELYFTAGPDNETHGLFGEIEFVNAEEE